ncbi:MAG: hypothetical protein IJ656_01610 [Bacilli bacterium]|nr:hypothetical protein [Bacilli bacterium]
MKKVFKSKLFLSTFLLLGSITFSSCGFLGEYKYVITSTSEEIDEETLTKTIKVTLNGEEEVTYTFSLNKGLGIDHFSSPIVDSTNNLVIINAYLNEEETEFIELTLPLINGKQGKDGTLITGITYEEISDQKYMIISFNNKEDYKIALPKGNVGAYIKAVEVIEEESQNILNLYLDTNKENLFISIPLLKMNTITSVLVEIDENTGENVLIFTLTSGDTIEQRYNRTSIWYSGESSPESSLGYVGDFYFDSVNFKIYEKTGSNSWELISDLSKVPTPENSFKVTLNLNLSSINEELSNIYFEDDNTLLTKEYEIYEGWNFYSMGYELDYPKFDETTYEFLGWYTKEEVNPNIGKLDNLTPIYKDIEVFANWERVN